MRPVYAERRFQIARGTVQFAVTGVEDAVGAAHGTPVTPTAVLGARALRLAVRVQTALASVAAKHEITRI